MDVVRLDGTEHDLMALARVFPQGTVLDDMGPSGMRLRFDNDCVEGMASSVEMHFGMRLNVSNLTGRAPIHFPVVHDPTSLEFAFCRGAGSRAVSENGDVVDFGGGEFRIGKIARTTLFHYTADEDARDRSIQINLSPPALCELLGASELPAPIETVVRDPAAVSLLGAAMDARMYAITDEILECSSEGPASLSQRLYLEGKAMELLALLIDALAELETGALCRSDVERLHRARELLRERLSAPPSVGELARHIGMGERRFKAAFKAAFGAPVMSYARRLRLEQARRLLSDRLFSVTEVAAQVGYSNPSKFAAAYRREFGMAPSAR